MPDAPEQPKAPIKNPDDAREGIEEQTHDALAKLRASIKGKPEKQ